MDAHGRPVRGHQGGRAPPASTARPTRPRAKARRRCVPVGELALPRVGHPRAARSAASDRGWSPGRAERRRHGGRATHLHRRLALPRADGDRRRRARSPRCGFRCRTSRRARRSRSRDGTLLSARRPAAACSARSAPSPVPPRSRANRRTWPLPPAADVVSDPGPPSWLPAALGGGAVVGLCCCWCATGRDGGDGPAVTAGGGIRGGRPDAAQRPDPGAGAHPSALTVSWPPPRRPPGVPGPHPDRPGHPIARDLLAAGVDPDLSSPQVLGHGRRSPASGSGREPCRPARLIGEHASTASARSPPARSRAVRTVGAFLDARSAREQARIPVQLRAPAEGARTAPTDTSPAR